MKTSYERELLDCMAIVAHRNGGEFHGDIALIADKIACEMDGGEWREGIRRLERLLIERGLQYLTSNSPVCYFSGLDGQHHIVERRLCDE